MRARFAILAGMALAGMPLMAVGAETPVPPPPPPPHHPELAGCAIKALVAAIDRGDRAFLSDGRQIYSDKLGEVTADELDQFFTEFAPRDIRKEGANDLELTNWGLLVVSEVSPLYVITIKRGPVMRGHWSAWLVQFRSDKITTLRRADELWPFADGKHFFATENCSETEANG